MSSKGDWKRPTDNDKFDKGYEKAFGKKCKLKHQHGKECQSENKKKS